MFTHKKITGARGTLTTLYQTLYGPIVKHKVEQYKLLNN